jgi:hypothetical protein
VKIWSQYCCEAQRNILRSRWFDGNLRGTQSILNDIHARLGDGVALEQSVR